MSEPTEWKRPIPSSPYFFQIVLHTFARLTLMKRLENLSVPSDHGVSLSHKVEIISNSCPGCILNQICPTNPNSTCILMTAYPNYETHLRWTLAGTCIRRAGWLLLHLRHGKRKFEWLCVWLQLWYNFSIECRISIATKWLCSFRGR